MLLPLDRLNTKFNIINRKYGDIVTSKIKDTIMSRSTVSDIIFVTRKEVYNLEQDRYRYYKVNVWLRKDSVLYGSKITRCNKNEFCIRSKISHDFVTDDYMLIKLPKNR